MFFFFVYWYIDHKRKRNPCRCFTHNRHVGSGPFPGIIARAILTGKIFQSSILISILVLFVIDKIIKMVPMICEKSQNQSLQWSCEFLYEISSHVISIHQFVNFPNIFYFVKYEMVLEFMSFTNLEANLKLFI